MDTSGASSNFSYENNPRYPQYPPYPRERRKSRWWIPLLIIGIIIIGFVVIVAGFIAAVSSSFKPRPVVVKHQSVLQLKVSGTLEERAEENLFENFFSERTPTAFFDVLLALKRAKNDENIEGLYIRAGDIKAGFSKLSELRDAIQDFKKSGKFVYAFIETGDEKDYYIASTADSIFMPTEGLLEMNGFATVVPFLKGTMDKIGVEFYVQQFEEYKSAGEQLSRKNFSEPAKFEVRELLQQRLSVLVAAISESRSIESAKVLATINRGVYTTDSLMAVGFIDGIRSETSVKKAIQARVNDPDESDEETEEVSSEESQDKPAKDSVQQKTKKQKRRSSASSLRLVTVDNYIQSDSYRSVGGRGKNASNDDQIAIITASGSIVSKGDPSEQIVSSSLIKYLQKVRDNKNIKVVILRIDSPGGSVIASDAIWEEIRLLREVKPVYASMSDVAASGGYYIAMPCDTIIAHKNTVTGSIGVVLTLPIAAKLMENLGVSVDTIKSSPDAIPYDPSLQFTEQNRQRLYSQSEKIYKRFVSRVAESRHKTFEQARALAKGRVWTGEAAFRQGLVDTLGGMMTAIFMAKRRLGYEDQDLLTIKRYPERRDAYQVLLKRIFNDESDEDAEYEVLDQSLFKVSERKTFAEKIPFWALIPESLQSQFAYLWQLASLARSEQTLMALPFLPEFR